MAFDDVLSAAFVVSCYSHLFCVESKKKALQEYILFLLSLYVLICTFLKKLFVALHHDVDALLFYFYIFIKFTLSKIVSTMKKR